MSIKLRTESFWKEKKRTTGSLGGMLPVVLMEGFNVREFIVLCALNDAIKRKHSSEVCRFENEHVLKFGLFNVENFLDL